MLLISANMTSWSFGSWKKIFWYNFAIFLLFYKKYRSSIFCWFGSCLIMWQLLTVQCLARGIQVSIMLFYIF